MLRRRYLLVKYMDTVSLFTSQVTMQMINGVGIDVFQQLSTGSVKGKVYEHIRKNTNNNSPVTGTYFLSFCNVHLPPLSLHPFQY
jgi:hypothetical protein